jgi:hypothetical protein
VIACVTVHVQVYQCYVSRTVLMLSTEVFDLHKGKRKAWQYPWKICSDIHSLCYTIYDKSNITNKISIRIMNPYQICDTRY